MGYLGNFIVYALAMVGIIVVALLVFKHTTSGGNFGRKSKYLRVIDTLSLGQRKNLYIVSTGKEQFLISGNIDNATLISKIEPVDSEVVSNTVSFKETLNTLPKQSFMDKSNIGIHSSILDSSKKPAVMRSLIEKIGSR